MKEIEEIVVDRPWLVTEFAEKVGLSMLAMSTLLDALRRAHAEYGNCSEVEMLGYRAAETRELSKIYVGPDLQSALKRAENALRKGRETTFGCALFSSPFKWNATVQSLLASQSKVTS